jgi:hypothetical protein
VPVLELEMNARWLWSIISANLLVLIVLVFVYPQLMISPGPLEPAHAELATDCFACHTPLRGASASRCITCHAPADIGLRTTKGTALPQTKPARIAFHQELSEQNCLACHSDHAGPKLTHRSRKPFPHALLQQTTRERCESCHAAPENAMHRSIGIACARCHKTQAWKPAGFDHAALPAAERNRCESCHKAPSDTLHQQITGSCAQCHSLPAWKPANFDHDKYFGLDGDHKASCVTCHTGNDYKRYTCYGCHVHTPANILRKHRDEGANENLDNCVRCHRSAKGEGDGGGERD